MSAVSDLSAIILEGKKMKFQRMLANGKWSDETKPERIEMFINKAVERDAWFCEHEGRSPMSAQDIRDELASGAVVAYDTDWYAKIRDADAQPQPKPRQPDYPGGRLLDCGHTVKYAHQVMNTSLGTSCAACYDRMSN
jgi:hypothetical protein